MMRRAFAVFLGCSACAATAAPSSPTSAPTTQATAASAIQPPAAPANKVPENASEVLLQQRGPFDLCYAQARKVRPDLGRTNVQISFKLDAGKLSSVEFAYRNRWDDTAKDCMRAAAEALTFPPSFNGSQSGTIVFAPP